MSYERDEAMRQQEATEAMIRMRDPDRRAGGLHPDPLADRGEIKRLREALERLTRSAEYAIEKAVSVGLQPTEYEARSVEIARAALSTPPAAERGEWKGIKSAPRDGTRFWGSDGDDAIAMFWHDGFGEFVSTFNRLTMAQGYTIDGESFKDHSPVIHKPTGWMPLPAPPSPRTPEGQ